MAFSLNFAFAQIPPTINVLKLWERNYCESLEINPDFLARFKNLKSLELNGFVRLVELYEGFGLLSKLVELDLIQCGLLELPKSLGQLKSMRALNLSSCSGLKELPESIGELECLETLSLDGCSNLKHLPWSFNRLKSLKYVSLRHCQSLQDLPEGFGLLQCLQNLDLSFCEGIKVLPSTFHQLSSLRFLYLIWCDSLRHLPDDLGDLTSLVKLEIFCRRLERLPNSIGQLKSLSSYMIMYQCFKLKQLPEEICDLNLELLELPDCFGLERLPERFAELKRLKHLRLCTCKSLVRLPTGFGTLPALEELNLNACIKLEELCGDFDCLPSLKKLHLSRCKVLKGVWMDTVINCRALNYVDIRGCFQLQSRWTELRKVKDWEILVNTEEGDEDGRLLRKAASMFFNDECLLFDCQGCEFKPSTLLPKTRLVFVFEWNISRDPWKQFMENIEGLLKESTNFQIIYFRKGYPVADGFIQASIERLEGITLGIPCDYSRVSLAFETLLSQIIGPSYIYGSPDYAITTTVMEVEGTKQFSRWENISNLFNERNFKSENYIRIKELSEVAQKNNIELLRSLLMTQGKDFILSNSKQVSIDSLQDKMVLFLISKLQIFPTEFCALKEMYIETCGSHQFEIVWMPIVDPYHDTWGPYVRTMENMPWPAMGDPWSIEPAVLKFVKEDLNFQNSALLIVVDDKGKISNHNFKETIERWGVEAYPFTYEKLDKLRKAQLDELKAKSSVEALFKNFDCSLQVKKSFHQGQQICLYGGDPMQIVDFTQTLTSSGFSASVPIIYVGRRHAEAENLNSEEGLHERNRQGMHWLSLSYVDAWKFWQRVDYLLEELIAADESENLAKYRVSLGILSLNNRSMRGVWMTMVDESGEVMSESNREKLVQQLNKGQECHMDMLMEGISCGEVEELLKERFEHGLFPQEHHLHHTLLPFVKSPMPEPGGVICDMCGKLIKISFYFKCTSCPFDLCVGCYDLSSQLLKRRHG
ncbi:putative disease resistance protein At4g19050 [Cryptomeria japonica]|uniref:putative disease resistance protein At4g19050 n=1 Tax=Cryptomeria japonica TaxID=3369 RepID=UPI0027DA559C|nr:putative disease resistance protein At4g19050 [Cryptomeria japonica]